MQHYDQGKPILIGVVIAVITVVLFALSFGIVLLANKLTGRPVNLQSSGQIAGLPTPALVSGSIPQPFTSATSTTTFVPSPTESVQVTTTTLTLPEPTLTVLPSVLSPTLPEPTPTAAPVPTPSASPPTPIPLPTATVIRATSTVERATVLPPTPLPSRTVTVVRPTSTVVPPTATPSISLSRVTVARAFVYDGPSTNRAIIGAVERGDELVVLGSSSTWYLVRVNGPTARTKIEGGQGWVAQDQVTPPTQKVPVITP